MQIFITVYKCMNDMPWKCHEYWLWVTNKFEQADKYANKKSAKNVIYAYKLLESLILF